jgi:hypothetical protein
LAPVSSHRVSQPAPRTPGFRGSRSVVSRAPDGGAVQGAVAARSTEHSLSQAQSTGGLWGSHATERPLGVQAAWKVRRPMTRKSALRGYEGWRRMAGEHARVVEDGPVRLRVEPAERMCSWRMRHGGALPLGSGAAQSAIVISWQRGHRLRSMPVRWKGSPTAHRTSAATRRHPDLKYASSGVRRERVTAGGSRT